MTIKTTFVSQRPFRCNRLKPGNRIELESSALFSVFPVFSPCFLLAFPCFFTFLHVSSLFWGCLQKCLLHFSAFCPAALAFHFDYGAGGSACSTTAGVTLDQAGSASIRWLVWQPCLESSFLPDKFCFFLAN